MTQAVLLGGLFIGVLSALPFINLANCCCLWMIGGGAIAVSLAQEEDRQPLGLLDGARIGFRAGLVGAVIWLLASLAVDQLAGSLQQRAADAVLRGASDMPAGARAWLEAAGDRSPTPLRFVIGFFFQTFVAAPFAALGGIFGAAIFGAAPPVQEEP